MTSSAPRETVWMDWVRSQPLAGACTQQAEDDQVEGALQEIGAGASHGAVLLNGNRTIGAFLLAVNRTQRTCEAFERG